MSRTHPPNQGLLQGEETLAMTWADDKAGRPVVIGVDMQERYAGLFDFAAASTREVLVPDGRQIWLQRATEYSSVWPFWTLDCDIFIATAPLAAGTPTSCIRTPISSMPGRPTRMCTVGWRMACPHGQAGPMRSSVGTIGWAARFRNASCFGSALR